MRRKHIFILALPWHSSTAEFRDMSRNAAPTPFLPRFRTAYSTVAVKNSSQSALRRKARSNRETLTDVPHGLGNSSGLTAIDNESPYGGQSSVLAHLGPDGDHRRRPLDCGYGVGLTDQAGKRSR